METARKTFDACRKHPRFFLHGISCKTSKTRLHESTIPQPAYAKMKPERRTLMTLLYFIVSPRGLNPWPSAYTSWSDKTMKIWEAEVLDKESGQAPGTVAEVDKKTFAVQTGKGMLKILSLQLPGKKRMDTDAFLRGNQIKIGETL